jgi:DNA-binding NarL/FixJ family response regulator
VTPEERRFHGRRVDRRGDVPQEPTQRQEEVLALICDGWSIAEAAGLLSISPHTAKHHLVDLYRRLGINQDGANMSRTLALVAATRLGWLQVPEHVRRVA